MRASAMKLFMEIKAYSQKCPKPQFSTQTMDKKLFFMLRNEAHYTTKILSQ